jgi:2-polyprenyl-6-methoxyphenol hydroxylase-like FAD-dependent oxidoreductase
VNHLNALLEQGPETLEPLFPGSDRLPTPVQNVIYGIEKLLETLPVAAAMAALDSRPFVAPPRLQRIVSPQFSFPLSAKHADRYALPRLALVGDAAHTVHPMAGQGLNLGLQDATGLVDAMESAAVAGMDPSSFLHEYEARRRAQVGATLAGIHALQRAFGLQPAAFKYAKALGMSAIQSIAPLRTRLVQAACLGIGSPDRSPTVSARSSP